MTAPRASPDPGWTRLDRPDAAMAGGPVRSVHGRQSRPASRHGDDPGTGWRAVRGPEWHGDSEHAPLRCFAWSVLDHRHDREGVPVLLYAYSSAQPRSAGVPTIQSTIRLGWTLSEVVDRRAADMLANPVARAQLDAVRYRDRTGDKYWSVREERGPPAEEVLGLTRAFHRFVAGCLSFLEQRIAIAVDRPASRGARRRVEHQRPLTEPASAVRVIELRRARAPRSGRRCFARL
jgi:hypothetical protein